VTDSIHNLLESMVLLAGLAQGVSERRPERRDANAIRGRRTDSHLRPTLQHGPVRHGSLRPSAPDTLGRCPVFAIPWLS